MDRLFEGYRRFRTETWPTEAARYQELATVGQSPETLVIACSDSRVDPQTIFDAGPGELFIVRNVAALVPPYKPDSGYHGTSAALEFSVRVLKVKRIVVMGHAQCGGVQAMARGAPEEARDFVEPWMQIAKPALKNVPDDLDPDQFLSRCETEVVRLSLANLMTFPWVEEAVSAGRLELNGCRFAIRTGALEVYDGERFAPVT